MLQSDFAITNKFVLITFKSDKDVIAAYHKYAVSYLLKQLVDDNSLQVVTSRNHYWRLLQMPIAAAATFRE